MQKIDWNAKISKKATLIIVIAILVASIVCLSVVGVVHNNLQKKKLAEITNISAFEELAPNMLVYVYNDNADKVDLNQIISVSRGAEFYVAKVTADTLNMELIDASHSAIIDVSDQATRRVYIKVTSADKTKLTDYLIILVSQSKKNNRVTLAGSGLANDTVYYSSNSKFSLPELENEVDETEYGTATHDFLGWYKSEDYKEESRLEGNAVVLSGGLVTIYARFRATSPIRDDEGVYTGYISCGKYPQTKVSDYTLLASLRDFAANNGLGNGVYFTYDGQKYYRYKPTNYANVNDNGFSSSTYYYFKVEPVIWKVLDSGSEPSVGSQYTLLSDKVLNCESYSKVSAKKIYDMIPALVKKVTDNIDLITNIIYDPESMWYRSIARETLNTQFNNAEVFGPQYESLLAGRNYTYYGYTPHTVDGETNYVYANTDKVYLLSHSEAISADYGFNSDVENYDNLRRSSASDFAKAMGVYTSDSYGHEGKSSWWLRGAGSTYGRDDKRIAYVRYTGQVHSYTATNYLVRSGLRPVVRINYGVADQ